MNSKIGSKAALACLLLLATGLLAAFATPAVAQQASAVVVAVKGPVELQPRGQAAWQPLRAGMQVLEGANVRSMAGGSAELRLPDGSTLSVAENTRIVVTKLDFDRNRMRSAFFHLATGKVKGMVSQAAAKLVAARQNNFAITTPTAVAAVRGTTIYATYDPVTNQTTYIVTGGIAVIRDVATGQMITIDARTTPMMYTLGPGGPTGPTPASQAQVNEMASTAQPGTPGTATVLSAPTVFAVDAGVVIVGMIQAGGGGGGEATPPMVVVSPMPGTSVPSNVSPIR